MKAHLIFAAPALLALSTGCQAETASQADAQVPTTSAMQAPEQAAATPASRTPDVVYVPTPQPVVDAMLKMAKVRKGDVLYDLGSGDGRIPVTAARDYGIRATGIDIDPVRIAEANENVRNAKVGDLVTIKQGDLFQADISDATVVTLYLLESLNEKLRPKLLRELRPGTRIVSHAFRMGDWEPEAQQQVNSNMIYMWTVPARK